MPTKRTTSGESYAYSAVFVGVQMDSGAVTRVWVGSDGTLWDGAMVFEPFPGVTAAGVVMTVFGLIQARRFSADDLLAAAFYAARLRRDKSRDPGLSGSAVR